MQVEREIDSAARVVILKLKGRLRDQDLLSLAGELEKAPEIAPSFSLLIDLREANGREVSNTAVRALAARRLVLSSASRRAVVVPSEFGFGMARMYEILREGQGGVARAFRDYDEAGRWVATGVR